MRQKALMIGGLNTDFTGPAVRIDDRPRWRVIPEHDYRGQVDLVVQRVEDGPADILRLGPHPMHISGFTARVVVRDVPEHDFINVHIEDDSLNTADVSA